MEVARATSSPMRSSIRRSTPAIGDGTQGSRGVDSNPPRKISIDFHATSYGYLLKDCHSQAERQVLCSHSLSWSDQPNRCTNAGCAPMAGGPGVFCDGTWPRMTAHHRSSERVSLLTI